MYELFGFPRAVINVNAKVSFALKSIQSSYFGDNFVRFVQILGKPQ